MKKKKKHKEHSNKKPRSEFICGTTAGKTTEISVSYDPITGQIHFGNDMINTRIETSYSRPRGPKFLNRTPLDCALLKTDPNQALAANYDILFAVGYEQSKFQGTSLLSYRLYSKRGTHVALRQVFRLLSTIPPFLLEVHPGEIET